MLVSNAGGDATRNKENVTTVVLMDGAVEKIGLEMDVMVHLVDHGAINVS